MRQGADVRGAKGPEAGRDITGGAGETAPCLFEANPDRAVPWTKPDDWQFDPEQPLAGLGKAHRSGFNVIFADGHSWWVPAGIDPKEFHAMLTVAGGETVTLP